MRERKLKIKIADYLFRCETDLLLLSHWKQITATLLHATYVTNGFSYFDSRTANIERALRDLNPLLQVYSISSSPNDGSRLHDLRDILRKGARFAFTLFGQPSFWQFDWSGELPNESSQQVEKGKSNSTEISGEYGNMTRVNDDTTVKFLEKSMPSLTRNVSDALNTKNLVVWPALMRIVEINGARVLHEDGVLSEKITLEALTSRSQDDKSPQEFVAVDGLFC